MSNNNMWRYTGSHIEQKAKPMTIVLNKSPHWVCRDSSCKLNNIVQVIESQGMKRAACAGCNSTEMMLLTKKEQNKFPAGSNYVFDLLNL